MPRVAGGQTHILRRPTPGEAGAYVLDIADRLERIALDLEKMHDITIHRKAGHVGYLKTEAQNLRSAVRREKRLMKIRSKIERATADSYRPEGDV